MLAESHGRKAAIRRPIKPNSFLDTRSSSPSSSHTPWQLKHLSIRTSPNKISSSGMPHLGHFMKCRARAVSCSSNLAFA